MSPKYDIIIFGATSFTGKCMIREVLKAQGAKDSPSFTWAIAGRSPQKMKELMQKVATETGDQSLLKIDLIQADVGSPSSIQGMVKQAQIILNIVGPFAEYGEVVVKACVEAGTHHLDLSAEPSYLLKMESKYGKKAEENKCFIIGACGSGSIPSDCGAEYLQRKFFQGGTLNSVESFLKFPAEGSKLTSIHYATWHSIILLMHESMEMIRLKKELYAGGSLPSPKYSLPFWPIQYREEVGDWCLFNPFPDGDVMERTQRYKLQNGRGEDIIQAKPFLQFPKFVYAFMFAMMGAFIGVVAQFKFGVKMLLDYPGIFTFGLMNHTGPSVEEMEQVKATITIVAKGWEGTTPKGPPNKVKIMRVKWTNPMYGGASIIFLHAALTILAERNKMPKRGGVYSPGIAFAETTLIDRLNKNGVIFKMDN